MNFTNLTYTPNLPSERQEDVPASLTVAEVVISSTVPSVAFLILLMCIRLIQVIWLKREPPRTLASRPPADLPQVVEARV